MLKAEFYQTSCEACYLFQKKCCGRREYVFSRIMSPVAAPGPGTQQVLSKILVRLSSSGLLWICESDGSEKADIEGRHFKLGPWGFRPTVIEPWIGRQGELGN